MYVLQDANWNVTSTVDYDGKVLDRVRLTPYGIATFDTETVNGDYDGDGDTDSSDSTELTNCYGTATGACRIFDYDDNGTINVLDTLDFAALSPTDSDVQRQPARRTSPNRFARAHQGLYLDCEVRNYQNRRRIYSLSLNTFIQPDPAAFSSGVNANGFDPNTSFKDGMNSYCYVSSNPTCRTDPSGLEGMGHCCAPFNMPLRIRPEEGCQSEGTPGGHPDCDADGYITLPPGHCGACDGHKGISCPGNELYKISNGCTWDRSDVICDGWFTWLLCHCWKCGCTAPWW